MIQRRLALLGAPPAFPEPIHVGRPNIGKRDEFMRLTTEILDRRLLTNSGPVVEEFESQIARTVGATHCIATSNATVGLELAYEHCGLSGEVIVPSFTFVATVHTLVRSNCTPVFCDIDPVTHCLDLEAVESLITPRTGGIVAVHLWGGLCDVDRLASLASAHGLPLVYDAAHAFGCSSAGRSLASFGNATVFSFHATKVLNTFEGGAIVTDDSALASRLRLARSFGFAGHDDVVSLGTNAKMTEVSAAMGLVNLASLDEFVGINRRNHGAYTANLADVPGLQVQPFRDADSPNFQYVVVQVDEQVAGLSRDDLMAVLAAEKVHARRYFWPGVHRMQPYRTLYPEASAQLPHTEAIASRVLVLPTGTAVDASAVDTIGAIIRSAVANADAIRAVTRNASPVNA